VFFLNSTIKLPVPVYLKDIESADSEHELYAYVRLVAAHYHIELSPNETYMGLAKTFKDKIDSNKNANIPTLKALYCMYAALLAADARRSQFENF
jgi:hypothetical protein